MATIANSEIRPYKTLFYIIRMTMFDYISFANSMRIDSAVVASFEGEAKEEFPNDDMLRELHIMRALKTYFNKFGALSGK